MPAVWIALHGHEGGFGAANLAYAGAMMQRQPSPRQPPLFNVPLHVAFADALAAGLLARTGADPIALARAVVLLPNRRAVAAVTQAFVRAMGGGGPPGLLLPRLVPVGDLDEATLARLAPAAALADLARPPAVPLLVRRLELARLTHRLPGARAAVERLRLGDALAAVLDALLAAEIPPDALRTAADGQELAVHWEQTLAYLQLIIALWPDARAGHGGSEGATRLAHTIDQLIAAWAAQPPATLVVAAGIANPTPPLVRLLAAVLALPAGLVLLPGLDDDASPAGAARWQAIAAGDGADGAGGAARNDCGHPQWTMKALLMQLGLERADVQRWPHAGGALDGPAARATALLAAMAPAATLVHGDGAGSTAADLGPADLGDVWLAEAASAAQEAQLVALALREALEVPGRRAALVTPDPLLARRVAAHCRRWGIVIDDSAGTPLALTPPGALAGQLVDALAAAFAPHQLLAVLKHRLVTAASADAAVHAGLCDLALRGVRPPPGLDAAGEAVARWAADHPQRPAAALERWWQGLADALAPLEALREAGTLTLPALMAALRHAAQALCGDAIWSGPDGRLLAGLVAEIEEYGQLFGPFMPDEAPALFAALIAGQAVRVPGLGHPRLAILGPLEAQAARADLMVLAGLNEGSWPPQPAPDPWLAPAVRARLGLPGTALAQGLIVQDFLRAACAPKVLITRARRDGTAPRLPSRLWLRLIAHFGPTLRWRHDLAALAGALDAGSGLPARVAAPAPAPPLDLRPRGVSITEIDTLIADPFAFHARRILKLAPLDPLDQDPTAAVRGTLAHTVMERWIKAGHGSIAQLDAIIAEVIDRETGHFPLLAAGWAPRMRRALRAAGEQVLAREAQGWTFLAEVQGRLRLPNGIALRGRIDRLDRHAGGDLLVVDYKTGQPPAAARVRALDANQLALGLALAAAGALEQDGVAVPPGRPAGIEYLQLAGRRDQAIKAHRPLARGAPDVADHIAAALDRAEALTSHYLLAATPFRPKLRPQWAWRDYDHLARVAEWINRAPQGRPA